MDEDITRRREQIDDQPVAAVAMVVQVASQENAQHHSKQNLPGQAEFYTFHQNNFLNGAPFPVQKRENVTYCQGMNCVALVCRFFNAYDQYHLRGMLRNPLTTELFAALMHNNASLWQD